MIISKLLLKNWKNFQSIEVNLAHRVFVIGPNASGKSNLLDAIRFMYDIVKQPGGLQYAVNDVRGGVSKIRCLAARRDPEVSLEFHLAEAPNEAPRWKYRIAFKHTGGGIVKNQATVTEEYVWHCQKGVFKERHANTPGEDKETLKFTHLEQVTSNTEFREIYFFFQENRYLHVVPQLVREAESYVLSSNKEDFYGRNLLERISRISAKTRNAYLRRISNVLQIAVPQLKQLEFIKDDRGIPHLQAKYQHWRQKGAKQQETQFSDGTLRLIGFMWALLDGTETLLLEEPELYLHTAIIKQLPEFISRFQRRKNRLRQVIITTHSFDLLSGEGISPREVILLEPDNEGTKVSVAEQIDEVQRYLEAGFSMAEAVVPRVAPKNIEHLLQLELGI